MLIHIQHVVNNFFISALHKNGGDQFNNQLKRVKEFHMIKKKNNNMKKIIPLFVLLSIGYSLKCQNINKPYGFLVGDTICIYKNYKDSKPIYYIYNSITDSFFQIEIIKEYKEKFFVNVNCINCKTYIDSCWINKKNAGIGLRNKTINFVPLYNKPDYNSKFKILNVPTESILAKIVDIKDHWVKISFEFKNKKFIGWLAPENQCSNLYTMCLGE